MVDVNDFSYYKYNPSLAAAIIFIILFFGTTSFHMYQMVRGRTWYFTVFVVGGIFEFVGYIGRAASAEQTPNWTIGPYLIQTLFILVSPALFAASIYMTLGRIVLVLDGERECPIRRTWMTKIFVSGDVLCFLMQGAGGGFLAGGETKPSDITTGQNLIIGGLCVQLIFFGLFVIVAAVFQTRIQPRLRQANNDVLGKKPFIVLYAASVLIFVRSVFRVIEYVQGFDGYILRHEIFLYIFDSVLMLGVMLAYNVVHPNAIAVALRNRKAENAGLPLTQPGEDFTGLRDDASKP